MPSIALGTMLVTAILLLLQALRAGSSRASEMDEEFGKEATGINFRVIGNVLALLVLSVLSWFLISHVGFEPAMTLLLVIIMWYVGVRKPLTIGLTAILMPIILSFGAWYFFVTEMPGFWR